MILSMKDKKTGASSLPLASLILVDNICSLVHTIRNKLKGSPRDLCKSLPRPSKKTAPTRSCRQWHVADELTLTIGESHNAGALTGRLVTAMRLGLLGGWVDSRSCKSMDFNE